MGVGFRQVPVDIYYFYALHHSDPPRHSFACPFRRTERPPGQNQPLPTIEWQGGGLNINLRDPMYLGEPRVKEEAEEKSGKHSADSANSRPLPHGRPIALLEALWIAAELNMWHAGFAGKRSYYVVRERLAQAATGLAIRKHPLGDRLYIPPAYSEKNKELCDAVRERFLHSLIPDDKRRRWYGFVVGFPREADISRPGVVGLKLMHCPLTFWIDAKDWKSWSGRWSLKTLDRAACVLRVLGTEGERGSWIEVADIATIELADRHCWIPVHSEFERRLALKLVEERRAFRKPLEIELEEGQPLLANFVLEDRQDRCHLEITGVLTGEDNPLERMEKKALYEKMEQAVWWWNPMENETPPVLPPVVP